MPKVLKFHLLKRAPHEPVSGHWRKHRDVLVWLCAEVGASERLIAYGFDLSRARVRAILRRHDRFMAHAQKRTSGRILTPGSNTLTAILSRARRVQLRPRVEGKCSGKRVCQGDPQGA